MIGLPGRMDTCHRCSSAPARVSASLDEVEVADGDAGRGDEDVGVAAGPHARLDDLQPVRRHAEADRFGAGLENLGHQ